LGQFGRVVRQYGVKRYHVKRLERLGYDVTLTLQKEAA
jgi:hypothetical protein